MKKLTAVVLLIVISLTSCKYSERESKSLLLSEWKVNRGDSIAWAKANFNDADWNTYHTWDENRNNIFKNYDGYAWYRTRVVIPSSLEQDAYNKDSLVFFLGAIDDCDQVFLNGYLIGENAMIKSSDAIPDTSFASVEGFYAIDRKYILSSKDKRIRWDKENIIAIRIYDIRYGGGFMTTEPRISALSFSDYLKFDISRFYKVDSVKYLEYQPINRNLVVNNPSSKEIEGSLTIQAENVQTKEKVYEKNEVLILKPRTSYTYKIVLPISTDPTAVMFKIKDEKTGHYVTKHDTVPYVLEKL